MKQKHFISSDEPREVWLNEKNRIHREDGPAMIERTNPNNIVYYWILNGDLYTFEEWCKATNKTKEEMVQMKLIYQGTFVNPTFQGNDV